MILMPKRNRNYFTFNLLYLVAILLVTCGKDTGTPKTNIPDKKLILKEVPLFNVDTAFSFIESQLAFGPRVPNTSAHTACGEFLQQKLKEYGATVNVQSFEKESYTGEILRGNNIIASFNKEAKKRILLAAHWDTRPVADQEADYKTNGEPVLGANDGASGVAVLLEVARLLNTADTALNIGVDIIFFDLEDYGSPETGEGYCLGSQYWSNNKHEKNYQAYFGILLDMVAGQKSQFVYEEISLKYAKSVLKKVWAIADLMGYGDLFVKKRVPHEIIDDHYFINVQGKIPTIDIIGYNPVNDNYFPETWHTQQDNLQNIDKSILKKVGQVLIQTLYQESD
jgi:Zn-dependent M28 family amino/carboxypeptidase